MLILNYLQDSDATQSEGLELYDTLVQRSEEACLTTSTYGQELIQREVKQLKDELDSAITNTNDCIVQIGMYLTYEINE